MSPMHEWARFYASLGWHVFPLVPGTKSPFKDSHGSSDASCDLAQVDAWWTANPEANIGMRPASANLYVFDVDPRNGGDVSRSMLEAQHGRIASPLTVISPRGDGGEHLYFRTEPGKRYNSAPGDGIDGKFNGYVLLPPSLHPCGRRYEWAGGWTGAEAAPIPSWLEVVRVERPQVERNGSLADLELVRAALANRDPSDYWSWVYAIASVKHWEDHTEGADGQGFEILREWSAQDPRHDDGQLDDKWHTFDSFKAGGRTLGSLLHEAGLTREQLVPQAAEAFAEPPVMPEPPRPLQWTTEPVEGFKGQRTVAELQAELLGANTRGYADRWLAGDVNTLIEDLAWRSGGNCQLIYETLMTNPAIVDSDHLKAMIAHNCAHRTTWYTVGALTPDQQQIKAQGLQVEIPVDNGKLVPAFHAILRALPHIGDIFQRDGRLVWVDPFGRIGEYDQHSLSHELESALRFVKGSKGMPDKLPENLAKRILGHRNFYSVQSITAAIPLPTARADGTVITAAGLDAQTGLFLLKGGDAPRTLDVQGLQEAVSRVWAPFQFFPIDSAASRGTMLAALLTTVCRAALPTAPAFLVNAQAAGTGKTLLSTSLMILARASEAALSLPTDPNEQAKTLFSTLKTGPRGIMFDNVTGVLKATDQLCSAMTSARIQQRGLGGNDMHEVGNRAVWVLNGNNVGLRGDMVRRVLTIGLESPESPETRNHSFDPQEVIRAHVETYRSDLLNILHTFAAHGLPQLSAMGFASFEAWNRLVRGCVLWLNEAAQLTPGLFADPLFKLREAQADDPDAVTLQLMLKAWHARFGTEPVYLRDVSNNPLDAGTLGLWTEAYRAVCSYQGRMDEDRLKYWLRSNARVKKGGMMFTNDKDRDGVARWRVEMV